MEQQQQGQVAQSDDNQDAQSQRSRSGNDDSWGVGSASALDNLRRQNFRGRRFVNMEDRPSSD